VCRKLRDPLPARILKRLRFTAIQFVIWFVILADSERKVLLLVCVFDKVEPL